MAKKNQTPPEETEDQAQRGSDEAAGAEQSAPPASTEEPIPEHVALDDPNAEADAMEFYREARLSGLSVDEALALAWPASSAAPAQAGQTDTPPVEGAAKTQADPSEDQAAPNEFAVLTSHLNAPTTYDLRDGDRKFQVKVPGSTSAVRFGEKFKVRTEDLPVLRAHPVFQIHKQNHKIKE